jgi:hypothetical protein
LALSLGLIFAVVLWWVGQIPASRPFTPGDGQDPKTYGFPLSPLLVDPSTLVGAGIPRDGIPALQEPGSLSLQELPALGRRFLLPSDLVVGVSLGGQARAYPLRVLVFHELVNDTLGNEPLLLVHQPLCGLLAVFSRRLQDKVASFGISGLVWNSCGLIYERGKPQRGLWLPLLGKAVSGPAAAAGERLQLLPFTLTTWQQWLAAHPTTTLLQPDRKQLAQYKRDPYSSYLGSELLRFPVKPPFPTSSPWRPKSPLLVLWPFQEPRVLPLEQVPPQGLQLRVRDLPLRVQPLPRSNWAQVTSEAGPLPPSLYVFAFAWYAANPRESPESWQWPLASKAPSSP